MFRVAFVALLLAGVAIRADEVNDPDVTVLTERNWDAFLADNDYTLVEFYAPWCGHCKTLAPKYAEAATILKKNDPPILLAKVDATEEGTLASKFDVRGYPTLKLFRNGVAEDYKGPRETAGIVSYMKKNAGPTILDVKTAEEAQDFVKIDASGPAPHDVRVVGVFSDRASPLRSSLMALAPQLREEMTFAQAVGDAASAAVAGAFDVAAAGNHLLVFRDFDGEDAVVAYPADGSTKSADLKTWLRTQAVPVVGPASRETAEKYARLGKPLAKLYVGIDLAANKKMLGFYTRRLKKMSAALDGKVQFLVANKEEFSYETSDLGFDGYPEAFAIIDGGKKYPLHSADAAKGFNKALVAAHAQQFVDGALSPWVKSEDVPDNSNADVATVVGKNFDEVVADDKDVLLEFYAPWCGHCKQLAPKYEKLGKRFKKVDGVTIAKLDATANDYPDEYQVSGYPTLYFKPKGGKPQKYEGGRELKDFVKYLKKNAKSDLSALKKKKAAASKDEL